MEVMQAFGVLFLTALSVTTVFGLESTIYLSVDDQDSGLSCIYSLPGDPTDWVPKASLDSDYEVAMDPFCVDSAYITVGAMAANPSQPGVILAADRLDQSILFFQTAAEGDVGSFFQSSINVTGIAVDYQSQNLYYTDPESGIVLVEVGSAQPNFDVLIKNVDDPHDIFVDPDKGYIFWLEPNVVKRAKLTGSSIATILSGVSPDTLLALDPDSERLYVLDQAKGSLRSMKYDGSGIKTLFDDPGNYTAGMFSGLAADQGYVFGAVANKAELAIWDQSSGERLALLSFSQNNVKQYGITVNRAEAISATGSCVQNKGGCSQLCIHGGSNSRTCECSLGYTLQSDGISCKPDYLTSKFALITDIGNDAILQVDITSGEVSEFPVSQADNRRIQDAVFDRGTHDIIWIDTGNGALKSKTVEHGAAETTHFTFSNESVVEGIAYDEKEKTIYYVDTGLACIGKVSIDKGHKFILNLTSDEVPQQIKVDPREGYIYWTNVGSSPTIERALMSDGSKREVLVKTELQNPTGLALNVSESRLYWVDSGLKRIEMMFLNGTGREMIEADAEAYSLSVDPDYIYVARPHDIRRYSISDSSSSTLGPRMFGLLNTINVYLEADDTTSDQGSGASHIVTDWTNHMMMLCATWLIGRMI